MRIILSPAKKMKTDPDTLPPEQSPEFLEEAGQLLTILQGMDYDALKRLWGCSDALAKLNFDRLRHMDLQGACTPAVLSYEGIQYQYMAPGVFTRQQLDFIREHLRILSGFYGLLRPFDGVVPYRLEMQAALCGEGFRNLYEFWGDKLGAQLCRETDFILNLASREYSKSVRFPLPSSGLFLTCLFGIEQNGRIMERGTRCKMARGEMVRFLAENQITKPGDIRSFDRLGYRFSKTFSTKSCYVFLQE